MFEQMLNYFLGFFQNLHWVGILLAVVYGAFWLFSYQPPFIKKPWLFGVAAFSALFVLFAVAFIQYPLQYWYAQWVTGLADSSSATWLILAINIPYVLVGGLVQEGAKMLPAVGFWALKNGRIEPKVGMVIGAVAGAGFGIMSAQYTHNSSFAYGWDWSMISTYGFEAIIGFWQQFFAVALQVACGALTGYGLAKGWGWQFFLLASGAHALATYGMVFNQLEILSDNQTVIAVAIFSTIVSGLVMWLYWKNEKVMVAASAGEPEAAPAIEQAVTGDTTAEVKPADSGDDKPLAQG